MRKFYLNQVLKKLANLQLAIILLFTIGIVVSLGTIIQQDEKLTFYQQNYPTSKPVLGFLTWKLLILLNLNHIYTSFWFILLLVLFSLSLISCTLTVQLPVLRRLRRWKFYNNNIEKVSRINKVLQSSSINDLSSQLHYSRYNIFRQGKKNYAYSGIIGKFGPIIVHVSIIMLLIGSSLGSLTSYTAQEIVSRGEIFHIQNLVKFGRSAKIFQENSWRVNDFWITYTDESKTDQFYSDLSLIGNKGQEIKRKTIFVNEPFIYKGITLYQTDWDIVGLKFIREENTVEQLPLKKIIKNGRKFWIGSIKFDTSSSTNKKIVILINDLQGDIYIYDDMGTLIQKSKIGQTFYSGSREKIKFIDFLTTTGLQIKKDPGIQTVFLSFFLLIISSYVSFLSYSQIWSVESKDKIKIAGNSNRAVLSFQNEFYKL